MSKWNTSLALAIMATLLLTACQPVMPPTSTPTNTPPSPTPAPLPTVAPPESVLFIGNSTTEWNLGLHEHLRAMAAKSDPPLDVETSGSILLGATLKNQWDTGQALESIRQGGWDVVVLQGEIPYIEDKNVGEFYEAVRRFDNEIKDIGAKNVLLSPWGYPSREWIDTDGITDAHAVAAEGTGAIVAPVGTAFQRATEVQPDLILYDTDLEHPNVLGTYLALNVLYATIFEYSPVSHAYRPADIYPDPETEENPRKKATLQGLRDRYSISDEDAEFLQRIAWDAVQEWQAEP